MRRSLEGELPPARRRRINNDDYDDDDDDDDYEEEVLVQVTASEFDDLEGVDRVSHPYVVHADDGEQSIPPTSPLLGEREVPELDGADARPGFRPQTAFSFVFPPYFGEGAEGVEQDDLVPDVGEGRACARSMSKKQCNKKFTNLWPLFLTTFFVGVFVSCTWATKKIY